MSVLNRDRQAVIDEALDRWREARSLLAEVAQADVLEIEPQRATVVISGDLYERIQAWSWDPHRSGVR